MFWRVKLSNDIRLQEGHPVDENLRPLKVGGKSTALEVAQNGDGARITGGLEVSGTGKSIVAEPLLTNSIISGSLYGFQLRAVSGINVYSGTSRAITFDSGSDIDLDAGTGDIKFYDDGDYGEYFKIAVTGGSGATILSTLSDVADGHLTLAPDGELNFTPTTEVKSDAPLKIKEAANAVTDTAAYGQLWTKNETPCELYFTTDAGDDIQITDGTSMAGGGGSGISTTLSDGNILVGNGSNVATSVNPSGDIDVTNAGVFSISSGAILDADVNASAAIAYSKLGTIPTWNQDTTGTAATVTGAAQSAITSLGTLTTLTVDDVVINGKVITIEGDAHDTFTITTGGGGATTIETADNTGATGHLNFVVDGGMDIGTNAEVTIDAGGHVEFEGCGVGFDLVTPTYNASDTDVDFTTGNKQFATFGSGNITDLNLIFPKVSGNFLLMLKQDGTGSRTVTNYKVWDRVDSSAASGSATVKFAGGSNPDLTDDANHVDIISFFYDCDNEIAYGVASLDFQF